MKSIRAEMAGTILEVKVKKGDSVKVGQEVALVESMKMEVALTSPLGGTVSAVHKAAGDFVNEGDTIIELGD